MTSHPGGPMSMFAQVIAGLGGPRQIVVTALREALSGRFCGPERPFSKLSDIDAGGHRRVPDSDNWARWAVSDP